MVSLDLDDVLAAGRSIFARGGGIQSVTVESVAAELDVEVSAVEEHADTTAVLRRAMLVEAVAMPVEEIERAVEAAPNGVAALEAFLESFTKQHLGDLTRMRVHLSAAQPGAGSKFEWTAESIREGLVPSNDRMFGPVAEKLSADWGTDELPHGIHPRRQVFAAYLTGLGFLTIRAMTDQHGDKLKHGDDELLVEVIRAFCAPTMVMRELRALNDVAAEVSTFREEAQLTARVPHLLCSSLDVEVALLLMLNDDGELQATSAASRDAPPEVIDEVLELLRNHDAPTPPPHYRRCLDGDSTVFVEDTAADPDWPTGLDEVEQRVYSVLHRAGSFVVTPVRARGVPVGVVAGHVTREGRLLDRRDVSRLETFATMVGLALDNVRWIASLSQRVDERTRELREAQGALIQAEKMAALGKLVAGIAHEINTPIGAVLSNAGLSERALEIVRSAIVDGSPKVERALRILEESNESNRIAGERISARVHALRSFARLDQAERQRADLHEGLESTLSLLSHELESIDVDRRFGELPKLECFASELNQVFMNLIANALQAMEGKGTLTVATGVEEGEIVIRISDTGRGIRPEDRERIFEPGFTGWDLAVGSGLGLPTSYRIVERHHGRIEVESEPGAGTTMTVRLPLAGP